MSQDLARKISAVVLRSEPLQGSALSVTTGPGSVRRPDPRSLTGVERYVDQPKPKRQWRPDLWPAQIWAPILCAPGVILVYVLACLALWIAHTL